MNEITLNYDFNGHPVRITGSYDEPWFVAADVCAALDLSNVSQAVASLEDDERGYMQCIYPLVNQHGEYGESKQDVLSVSESGMYSLIFKSRKEQAKQFQKWVTREVLPSIRKTGAYVHDVEMFLSHPVYKDLEERALEKITKTQGQVHRTHLAPYIRSKFIRESPVLVDAILREVLTFNSLYVADGAGGIRYLPKAKRKTLPSVFITPGCTEAEAEAQYKSMYKHVTHPFETLEQFKARMCDRPKPGIKPIG